MAENDAVRHMQHLQMGLLVVTQIHCTGGQTKT